MEPRIVFEDRELAVVYKPPGMESQESRDFTEDMVSFLKKHWRQEYVGVIHRLDKPVEGLLLAARTPQAASALSRDLQNKKIEKTYEALTLGIPKEKRARLFDYLKKDARGSLQDVVSEKEAGAREMALEYQLLNSKYVGGHQLARLSIRLETGRRHQIRLQCAAHGFPLLGDRRYNPGFQPQGVPAALTENVALCGCSLSFIHPKTKKTMTFKISPSWEEVWKKI